MYLCLPVSRIARWPAVRRLSCPSCTRRATPGSSHIAAFLPDKNIGKKYKTVELTHCSTYWTNENTITVIFVVYINSCPPVTNMDIVILDCVENGTFYANF